MNSITAMTIVMMSVQAVSAGEGSGPVCGVTYDARFDVDSDGQHTKEEIVEFFRTHSESFKNAKGGNINEAHDNLAIPQHAIDDSKRQFNQRVMNNNQLFKNFKMDAAKEYPLVELTVEEENVFEVGATITQGSVVGAVAIDRATTAKVILASTQCDTCAGKGKWVEGKATVTNPADGSSFDVQLVKVRTVAYPGVSLEDLMLARKEHGDVNKMGFWGMIGANKKGKLSGMRIPLAFNDGPPGYAVNQALFFEFQHDLLAALKEGGITDAVVQQVGSATQGWKGNPSKPLNPWEPLSDVDLAFFSEEALLQVKELGTPYNPKIIIDGQAVVFKNKAVGADGVDVGFYQTKVGKLLDTLSVKWTKKIYENFDGWAGNLDDFDFKLNVSPTPFPTASSIVSQRNDDIFQAFPAGESSKEGKDYFAFGFWVALLVLFATKK